MFCNPKAIAVEDTDGHLVPTMAGPCHLFYVFYQAMIRELTLTCTLLDEGADISVKCGNSAKY